MKFSSGSYKFKIYWVLLGQVGYERLWIEFREESGGVILELEESAVERIDDSEGMLL